jgi:hypothetical protein
MTNPTKTVDIVLRDGRYCAVEYGSDGFGNGLRAGELT